MNKKATTALSVIFAIMYFMVGMMGYQFLKADITIQRDATHLNCAVPDTHGDKLTCLLLDGIIPLLILAVLSVAGGIVTDKLV